MTHPPFHLAIPVDELVRTRAFYEETLGCAVGRTSSTWIDYDFFGHQLTTHRVAGIGGVDTNAVDGDQVPVRHFGVVLELEAWDALVDRLKGRDVEFLIAPRTRFAGQVGEQRTFFVHDPAGNALEFKAFASLDRLFASD